MVCSITGYYWKSPVPACTWMDCMWPVSQYRLLTGKGQEVKFVLRNKVHYILMKQLPPVAGVGSAHLYASSCKTSGMDLPQIKLIKEISTAFHPWVKITLKTDCGLCWGNRQNGPFSFSKNYFKSFLCWYGESNDITFELAIQMIWRTICIVLCHVKWS